MLINCQSVKEKLHLSAQQQDSLFDWAQTRQRLREFMTGIQFAPLPRITIESNWAMRVMMMDRWVERTMRKNERTFPERILLPTDLSSDTTEGLEYAVALARSYRAKLFLCHCLAPRAGFGASEELSAF